MECKAGCGFFGTEARNGYCSKCFNNPNGQNQQQQLPQGRAFQEHPVVEIPEGEYAVVCKTLTGKNVQCIVTGDSTIEDLIDIIHNSEGYPIDQIRLLFNGNILFEDNRFPFGNKTLREFYIGPNATAHIVLRLRGD